MRQLSVEERQVILALAERMDAYEKKQLLLDINDCLVEEMTPDGSRLMFYLSNYQRPTYHGQHPYSIEGTLRDCDGTEMSVLLHADENDRVLELEFIKWGDAKMVKPDWATFHVVQGLP